MLCSSGSVRADVVYVQSGDGTIQKFSPNGVGSLFATNSLWRWNGPIGLALDDVGNLYVGTPTDSSILKFLPDGTCSSVGSIDSVSGLAFDSAGDLYATIPNFCHIGKPFWISGQYSLSDTNGTYWPSTQTNLSYPINLAFDGAGNIYVANGVLPFGGSRTNINTIEKFSTNFTHLGTFARGLDNPWGIAFDNGGCCYIANSGANEILWVTSDGELNIVADESSGLSSPRGLACDSKDDIYVANHDNGTIEKFTSGGIGSVFASGLNSPSSIAIFPGSEPPTILLSRTNAAENQAVGAIIGSFSTQADAGYTTFNYSLANGVGSDDNGSFAIVGSNLLTGAIFNYEVKSNYSVRVQSDGQGGLSTQKVFGIHIVDVNEPPPSFSELPLFSNSNVILRWSSITNHQYTVHCSTNLLLGFTVLQGNIPGTPAINSFTDSLTAVAQKFWKVTADQ